MAFSYNPLLPLGLDKTQAAGAGATNFLALTDTPGVYTGHEGQLVVVNAAGDALEFLDKKCSFVHTFALGDWAGSPLQISIPQTTHGLEADPNKIMMVYKSGTPNEVTNVGITVTAGGDIVLEAGIAFAGYVVISDGCTGGGGGGGGTYSNANPTPNTVGGIPAGSTFSNQTMQQMWDALLYPYQNPAFTSFLMVGQSTYLEVGDTITGGMKTWNWTTSNSGNVQINTIQASDITFGGVLFSNSPNDGTENASIGGAITKNTQDSHSFRITGRNTNAANFSRDFTVNWNFRLYWGETTTTPLTETDIEALRVSLLTNTAARTYAFQGGGYKYICYPSSFSALTTFTDVDTGFGVPFEPIYTVSVTNSFGVTTNYNVQRSTNIMGSAINISAS